MDSSVLPCREEVNIKRLLTRCEEMSKHKRDVDDNWRLERYIEGLEEMVNDLCLKSYKPSEDVMMSYKKRLNFLKSYFIVQSVGNPLEKARAFQATPKPGLPGENRDVEHTMTQSVNSEIRKELFSRGDNNPRLRTTYASPKEDSSDLDEILKYHHTMQEKIADNMLVLARNIKEQSLVASNIIKNDSSHVEKSAQLADKNIGHLKVQSEKLQENTRKTSHCWIWILVIIVFAVFINMVLLMKMTKKKLH